MQYSKISILSHTLYLLPSHSSGLCLSFPHSLSPYVTPVSLVSLVCPVGPMTILTHQFYQPISQVNLKKSDKLPDGRTNKQTKLSIELRYAQLIRQMLYLKYSFKFSHEHNVEMGLSFSHPFSQIGLEDHVPPQSLVFRLQFIILTALQQPSSSSLRQKCIKCLI